MIIVPASRWATRPVCSTRPLTAMPAALTLAAPPVRWSTRPICATRRLHEDVAPVADIKWGRPNLLAA